MNYKYFIGKGNNSQLINQILKTRWWWNRIDNPASSHFVWTQLRHKSTLDRLSIESAECAESVELTQCWKPRVPPSLIKEKLEHSGFSLIKDSELYKNSDAKLAVSPNELVVHNRLPNNRHICTKKLLLKTMDKYYKSQGLDTFSRVPLTFHINNAHSESMKEFKEHYKEDSLWIIKPGEGTNRGNGIKVSSDLNQIISYIAAASETRSFLIQKYINKPLLVNKRKFDIRCYTLVSTIGSKTQGYFYKEGYIRTASKEFSVNKTHDKFIHLTNDAVQKKSEDYGKYELGNKMSYAEFSKYLLVKYPGTDFYSSILPQIQEIVTDSIKAVSSILSTSLNAFEIFGYDFMVDSDLNVWLIEVNTNPCLELSCSYLATIIPAMLENAFRIVLDPIFPPPVQNKRFKHWVRDVNLKNEFVLIFSEDHK